MKSSNLVAAVQFIGAVVCFQLSIFGYFYWRSSSRKHQHAEQFAYMYEHGLLKTDDIFLISKDLSKQVENRYHSEIMKEVSVKNSIYLKKDLQYPLMSTLGSILNWNPDDINIPISEVNARTHNKVPRFNFMNDQQNKASIKYRDANLPFVLYNIPTLTDTSALWTNEFFKYQFGNIKRDVEVSESNKFMYYTLKNKLSFGSNLLHWKTPQNDVRMTYDEFAMLVNSTVDLKVVSNNINSTHYYLTIPAQEGLRTDWVTEAFPYFTNNNEEIITKHGFDVFHIHKTGNNVDVVEHGKGEVLDPDPAFNDIIEYKGINCRIGSAGSSAAAHFDSHGNFVALVRGIRRYVLLPPNQCNKLHLYPKSHPSARHSSIDWGNATQHDDVFRSADALEIVLTEGDVLHIPSYWMHYIVSLTHTVQCNGRMAAPSSKAEVEKYGGYNDVRECGKQSDSHSNNLRNYPDIDILNMNI